MTTWVRGSWRRCMLGDAVGTSSRYMADTLTEINQSNDLLLGCLPVDSKSSKNRVFVVGVGMTKFEKPGSREWDYPDMAREAGTNALKDAGISFEEIEEAFAGYVYGDSCAGERAVYELGMTGIPIYNVNNNCSTGSTALYGAARSIRGVECGRAGGAVVVDVV